MRIEFDTDVNGFEEAVALRAFVRRARAQPGPGKRLERILADLDAQAASWIARSEYDALRTSAAAADATLTRYLQRWLRNWLGPGQREIELGRQRADALERAERAERSAFEALVDSSRIAAERDRALARAVRAEQRLAELKAKSPTAQAPE